MGEKGNLMDRAEDVAQNLTEQAPALWIEARRSSTADGRTQGQAEADVADAEPYSSGARSLGQEAE